MPLPILFRLAFSAFLLLGSLAWPTFAKEGVEPASPRNAVVLVGANAANDALAATVPSGPLDLDLYLQADKALDKRLRGELVATGFASQGTPADVVTPSLRLPGTAGSSNEAAPLPVAVSPSDLLHVKIAGGPLRPGTTYKGLLVLATDGYANRWEITLATGNRGTLAVDQLGTVKFCKYNPCSLFSFISHPVPYLPASFDKCTESEGSFLVTLRDKSENGPYHNLRVRFEPSQAPSSRLIASNFSLDSFSFFEARNGKLRRVDLEQRILPADGRSGSGIDLDYRGQRTFTARVKPLGPGEYAGALQFAADGSAADSQEARLPLVIQVRHHWLLPVLVILLGSIVGWFSSKYVVGFRKSRELTRQVADLRARADDLARPGPPRSGWEYPGESASYGLARVRVQLNQLARLAGSAMSILMHEADIQQQRANVELRLTALENLRDTRLRVQPVADGRPAAQVVLGGLLSRASSLIERPSFAQPQQTEIVNVLQTAEAWLVHDNFLARYREALADRLRGREIPSGDDVECLDGPEQVRNQLKALLKGRPSAETIGKESNPELLKGYDRQIAKVALLWRERAMPWAGDLAAACAEKASLGELFQLVDLMLWKKLAEHANLLKIEPDESCQGGLRTYALAEFHLTCNIPEIPDLTSWRLRYHPLHVVWRIVPESGTPRSSESYDISLVQYFPEPGKVTVQAALRWQGRGIQLNDQRQVEIALNPEYKKPWILAGELTEWAVIAIAAGFAVVTGMSSEYDATFGSYGQYLSLFLWAAGAGTGGNLFKQLGTASTPGGQPEAALSRSIAGGGAAAGSQAKPSPAEGGPATR